jgi:hypothetical protein
MYNGIKPTSSCLGQSRSFGPMTSGRSNHWGPALGGAAIATLLIWTSIAVAGPSITSVSFAGTNANLRITISGRGFGLAPGVPCKSCTTPHLNIGGRIGCLEAYNIVSWTDNRIILSGFQGNPGGTVLVAVENPQNKSSDLRGATIPASLDIAPSPTIESVIFSDSGRNLHMTVKGSGFGVAPRGVPGDRDLPFFSFIDRPFSPFQWVAGYTSCGAINAVTLKYLSWSATRIVISGFGSEYGKGSAAYRHWTVAPDDRVAIAVANSGTSGLKMSYNIFNFGPQDPGVLSPLGAGTLWGGRLP